jgi:hypothetical protein
MTGLVGATVVGKTGAQRSFGPLGRLEVPNAKEVVVAGTNAYVATGDGIAVVDVADPTALSIRATKTNLLDGNSETGLRRLWDVQVDGDRLVAVGPAQAGTRGANGAVLFDISDPDRPVALDSLETSFAIHNAAFDDGIVYLTGNNGRDHPVVILGTERDQFDERARWSLLEADETWGSVNDAIRSLHDVVVGNGIAYLLYWDAGTWILDVSVPSEPSLLGRLEAYRPDELQNVDVQRELLAKPGNHHGGAISDDGSLFALSIEAWTVERNGTVRGSPGGVELWDVRNPRTPERLSTIEAPPSPDNSRGGGRFTTAHNCDISGNQLYTSWYFGGVKRHDIRNPSAPREQRWWRDPEVASFWAARAVRDRAFFVAGSSNEGGATGAVYTFPDRFGDRGRGATNTRRQTGPNTVDGDGSPGLGLGTAVGTLGLGLWQLRRRATRSD